MAVNRKIPLREPIPRRFWRSSRKELTKGSVDVFDGELRGFLAKPGLGKQQEEVECVSVGSDGVRAGGPLLNQPLSKIARHRGGEVGGGRHGPRLPNVVPAYLGCGQKLRTGGEIPQRSFAGCFSLDHLPEPLGSRPTLILIGDIQLVKRPRRYCPASPSCCINGKWTEEAKDWRINKCRIAGVTLVAPFGDGD